MQFNYETDIIKLYNQIILKIHSNYKIDRLSRIIIKIYVTTKNGKKPKMHLAIFFILKIIVLK